MMWGFVGNKSLRWSRSLRSSSQSLYHASKRFSSSISEILTLVHEGKLSVDEAETKIKHVSFPSTDAKETLQSFANLDHGRSRRTGFPEVIFAENKTPEQVVRIFDDMALSVNELVQSGNRIDPVDTAILGTRVKREMWDELTKFSLQHGDMTYHEMARVVSLKASSLKGREKSFLQGKNTNTVVVATAGTTDLPVAEEAAVVLETIGVRVDRIYDVGVAGLHRIVRALPRLQDESVCCIIVCAGMDGALPSVVGGLVSVPVIAVPTSVGYGVSMGGISAMLTMLNSCAPGVAVVNIDNGFGAATLAFKCTKK